MTQESPAQPSRRRAVICALEALQPDYSAAKANAYQYFGLSISVGIVSGDPVQADLDFLSPWQWTVSGFTLYTGRKTADTWAWTPVDDVAVTKAMDLRGGASPDPVPFTPLDRLLTGQRDGPAGSPFAPERFKWDPYNVLTRTQVKKDSKPWSAILAQAARFPAPLPAAANLSLVFRADRSVLASADGFLAVPRFTFPGGGAFAPGGSLPQPLPPPASGTAVDQDVHTIEGAGTPDPPVTAYVRIARPAVPAANSFIDPGTLWIGKPPDGQAHSYDEDWRALLEGRAAEGFDLAQRLIDALRAALKTTDANLFAKDLVRFRAAVVASLYEMANCGLRKAPDGSCLAGDLLRAYQPTGQALPDGWQAGVVDALAAFSRQLTLAPGDPAPGHPEWEWRSLLLKYLPEVRGIAAISPPTAGEAAARPLTQELAELEQLQSVLAHPESLRRLVLGLWREAFAGHDAQHFFWDDLVRFLRDDGLARFDVRRRLALGTLGGSWADLVKVGLDNRSEQSNLRANFTTALLTLFHSRIAAEPAMPPTSRAPLCGTKIPDLAFQVQLPQALYKVIEASLRQQGDSMAMQLVPAQPPATAQVPPARPPDTTQVPHGITLQVDTLASPDDDQADILRQISGVGVLLREVNGGGHSWRCLNMAAVAIDRERFDRAAVLVPVPVHDQNQLRQGFLTYDNAPLIAKGPAMALTSAARFQLEDARLEPDDRKLHFLYPLDGLAGREWGQLPALKFGSAYETLLFAVGNSGALPAQLAKADRPCELRALAEFTPEPWVLALRRHFEYKRKVLIGQVRTSLSRTSLSDKLLPPIPPNVFPRGAETLGGTTTVHANDSAAEVPLVLLVPRNIQDSAQPLQETFKFQVKKPATDLDTWDRWVSAEDNDNVRKTRRNVWNTYHRTAATRHDGEIANLGGKQHEGVAQLLLDDPATADFLYAELYDIGGPTPRLAGSKDIAWPARPLSQQEWQLEDLRMQPIDCTCSVNTQNTPTIDVAQQGLVITVASGGLYEVRIWAAVPDDRNGKPASPRLGDGVLARAAESDQGGRPDRLALVQKPSDPAKLHIHQAADQKKYLLFSPLCLRVEVATETMPTSEQLWAGLSSACDDATSTLSVQLAPHTPQHVPIFNFVSRVELIKQAWRWQGRTLDPFPFKGVNGQKVPGDEPATQLGLSRLPALLQWEAQAFCDRPDADHLVAAMPLAPDQSRGRAFSYQSSLADDLRAAYYRFAVRAYSRYAGLFPPIQAQPVESWNLTPPPGRQASRVRQWHRLAVRCRRRLPLPKPAIKIVLPLTTSDDALDGSHGKPVPRTPGLLAVLGEPWYALGGLAEQLTAEIEIAENPDDPAAGTLWQFGPDPILTSKPAAVSRLETAVHLQGPVGHTFDRSSDAPLFAASSFIVSPPAQGDVSWYFAKIRFRRTLDPDGSVVAVPSEPSEPYWVQYLPDFSLYGEPKGQSTGELHLEIGDTAASLTIADSSGSPVQLQPQAADRKQFVLCLVLTQAITDATGRGDQERYLGVYFQNGKQWQSAAFPPGTTVPKKETLRARVVEVQYVPSCSSARPWLDLAAKPLSSNDFWEALFPNSTVPASSAPPADLHDCSPNTKELPDAGARIVRVSKPIPWGERSKQ